jgi:hypothetical protein
LISVSTGSGGSVGQESRSINWSTSKVEREVGGVAIGGLRSKLGA